MIVKTEKILIDCVGSIKNASNQSSGFSFFFIGDESEKVSEIFCQCIHICL